MVMKIAHLVFSFKTGGIENMLVDVINNWNKEDQLLLCILNNEINNELLSQIKPGNNVRVVCLNRKPGSRKLPYLIKLNTVLNEFKADTIHCHNNMSFKFYLPLRLQHPLRKVILTIHGTNKYIHYTKMDQILHKLFVDRITAISKAVRAEILECGISPEKVVLLINGLDSKKLNQPHQNTSDKKVIINVARLIPETKGQDILINAIKIVATHRQDFVCWLVGEAPKPEIKQEIETLIQQLGIQKYVELLGNRNDVPNLLSQSDLFVLPSRYEGFGLSLVEAMMAKVAVIASNNDGPQEILYHNKYGDLYETDNYHELAEIIEKRLEYEDKERIDAAYQYAIDNFGIDSMNKKLRDIYFNCR
jgi:glycosyltransferase involved in cell wall biosynthesis